jgi:hypothetical protein
MNATGFEMVSMDEMMQIEGSLFGITWNDVTNAVKYVAGVIITAVVTREVGKHI